VFIFHSLERYGGLEGKGSPRHDFITRRDRPPGDGWEYRLSLPAIKVEEAIDGFFRHRWVWITAMAARTVRWERSFVHRLTMLPARRVMS
jgi:hypothetical protein